MNRTLAEELKKAGFPQEYGKNCLAQCYWNYNDAVPEQGWYLDNENLAYPKEHTIYIPSLSEIIEKCGTNFRGLEVGDWLAEDKSVIWYAKSKSEIIVEGKTTEESVARLWLALNQK